MLIFQREWYVFGKLTSLNCDKCPGSDGLHPWVLKHCSDTLSKPLSLLYSQSFTTGSLPADWKQANVTPIFKNGIKSKAANYRPVSLTSQVCKILESIVHDEVYHFLV